MKFLSCTESDVPAPLATKMFYSQRNQRLRSALTYLYYGESSKEQYGDLVKLTSMEGNSMPLNSVQENAVPLQVLSPTNIPHEQINVQREKVCHSFFSLLFHSCAF